MFKVMGNIGIFVLGLGGPRRQEGEGGAIRMPVGGRNKML